MGAVATGAVAASAELAGADTLRPTREAVVEELLSRMEAIKLPDEGHTLLYMAKTVRSITTSTVARSRCRQIVERRMFGFKDIDFTNAALDFYGHAPS